MYNSRGEAVCQSESTDLDSTYVAQTSDNESEAWKFYLLFLGESLDAQHESENLCSMDTESCLGAGQDCLST